MDLKPVHITASGLQIYSWKQRMLTLYHVEAGIKGQRFDPSKGASFRNNLSEIMQRWLSENLPIKFASQVCQSSLPVKLISQAQKPSSAAKLSSQAQQPTYVRYPRHYLATVP